MAVVTPMAGVALASPASATTAVYASDSFNRTVTNGWGSADAGGAWNAAGPAYNVTPGSATIQADMTTPTNFLATGVSAQDVDVLTKISPPPTSSVYVDAGVGLRFQSTGDFYQTSAYYATANNNGNYTVELKRKPSNTQIIPDVNTTVPGGAAFWIRMEAQGVNPTVLHWKIWAAGSVEPSNWTATATDSTPALQAAGGVGVEAYAKSGSERVAFNAFSAASIAPPAPAVTCTGAAVACDNFNRTVSNGWGTSDVGGPWNQSGPAYAVTPGNATTAADASAPTNSLTSVSVRDADAIAKITPPPISSTYVDTGVGVRVNATAGTYYQLSAYYATTNNGGNYTVELKTAQPTETTLIIPEIQTTIPGGTPMWLRLQAQGANPTTLRAKIWADGTSEPTAWTATTTDSTAGLQAAGGVAALKAYTNTGTETIAFNGLLVNDMAYIAPTTLVANPAVAQLRLLRIYLPNLSATLTAGTPAVPLAGRQVTFSVGSTVVCGATTNTSGVASCSGSVSSVFQTVLNQGYVATYAGGPGYHASTGHGPIILL